MDSMETKKKKHWTKIRNGYKYIEYVIVLRCTATILI